MASVEDWRWQMARDWAERQCHRERKGQDEQGRALAEKRKTQRRTKMVVSGGLGSGGKQHPTCPIEEAKASLEQVGR